MSRIRYVKSDTYSRIRIRKKSYKSGALHEGRGEDIVYGPKYRPIFGSLLLKCTYREKRELQ
jgi:hypothetical protein